MFVDLTIAGLIQGRMWADGAPWIESVRATRPYWVVRALSAFRSRAASSPCCSASPPVHVARGCARLKEVSAPGPSTDRSPAGARGRGGGVVSTHPRRVLRMSYLVASVAGVAFFVMSVALLGWWPKRVLDEQTRAMGPEYVLP
jgi:cytochrome c oxidase cbb3-type subunit I/II